MSNEPEIKLVPNDEPGLGPWLPTDGELDDLKRELDIAMQSDFKLLVMHESEPWHGTLGGYTNHGCRKECCKKAHRDYMKRRRVERMKLLEANPDIVEHGKFSTYTNWMCRCKPCCAAEKARRK